MSGSARLSAAQQRQRRRRWEALRGRLAALDWLCQGSLFRVPPGAWRWTRKRRGKTVTVAISSPQAQLLRRAIANQRHAERLLSQMREISEEIVLGSAPGVRRRRRRKSS